MASVVASVSVGLRGSPLEVEVPVDGNEAIPMPVLGGIVAVLVAGIVIVLVLTLLVWRLKCGDSQPIKSQAAPTDIDSRPKLSPPCPEREIMGTSNLEELPSRYSYLEICNDGIYEEILRSPSITVPSICHFSHASRDSKGQTISRSMDDQLQSGYFYSNPTYSSLNCAWSSDLYLEINDNNDSDFAYCEPTDDAHDFVYSCASIYDDPLPLMPQECPLEVKPKNIVKVSNLGMGHFGEVMLAKTVGLSLVDLKLSETKDDRSISVAVAVKTLKSNGSREAFEREIKFMSRLNHENIIRLLGICSQDPDHSFIVMEYMEKGDLNQYLRQHSIQHGRPRASNEITIQTLIFISLQIAKGMKYLASLNFIHRDLATRNCLVGSESVVKVADFGLSRSIYNSYYFKISGKAMLPIRWMATECFYGRFSEKSDVWALGMTMWEIFTVAREPPLVEMSHQEVIADAIKGPDRRLPNRPEHCPESVFAIMQRCWEHKHRERATFEEVHSSLAKLHGNFKWLP